MHLDHHDRHQAADSAYRSLARAAGAGLAEVLDAAASGNLSPFVAAATERRDRFKAARFQLEQRRQHVELVALRLRAGQLTRRRTR